MPRSEAPRLEPLLPDLWRFADCCAVYLMRQGDRGLLIDLGSGAVLDHLAAVGVRRLEGVYFTHAHRDQCQGGRRALAAGVPLRFPAAAREFADPTCRADLQRWSPLRGGYPGRFEPPRPESLCRTGEDSLAPGVAFGVAPGQRLPFGELELEVLAAPGHLDHQVAYLLDWQDRRLCFSGDALHSEGRLHEAYHWETDHYTGAGLRQGADTLRELRYQRPDLLLPSHGPALSGDLWPLLARTGAALEALAELKDTIVPGRPHVRRLVPPRPNVLQRVSPHLWVWNNSYFLLSDAGPVLMVDNAGALPNSFWEQYRAHLGDRPITTVLVTHLHCDHVEGIEYLRRGGWTGDVWAHAALADCLEQPHRYRRPWLSEWAVRVDRRLAEGERFSFHEHALQALWAPGQTDLHACYPLTLDGRRALLSGDSFYPVQQWGGTGGLCGLNGGHPESWRRTIERYLQLDPEWVLASHIHPFEFRREDFDTMRRWCDDVAGAMRGVAADGCLERHHVPHTFNLEPYAQEARTGGEITLAGRFHNPYDRLIRLEARLAVPDGWEAAPDSTAIEIEPGAVAAPVWRVRVGTQPGTFLLAADLVFDGEYLGEKAEAYMRLVES